MGIFRSVSVALKLDHGDWALQLEFSPPSSWESMSKIINVRTRIRSIAQSSTKGWYILHMICKSMIVKQHTQSKFEIHSPWDTASFLAYPSKQWTFMSYRVQTCTSISTKGLQIHSICVYNVQEVAPIQSLIPHPNIDFRHQIWKIIMLQYHIRKRQKNLNTDFSRGQHLASMSTPTVQCLGVVLARWPKINCLI